ncbi:SHOCT domain-containing protein [Streptomyces sp. KM273126]|uniref:SHOCT domain-containing protein n=1 Tax=Streptomyces sp. KM273126 TaxID=2545247 RepID=UPI0015EBB630|nr:SHOCT domain-containing protein [Streptomyces sp. KM273126]
MDVAVDGARQPPGPGGDRRHRRDCRPVLPRSLAASGRTRQRARRLGHPALPGPPGPRSGPEQILAERYARGEIDEEEYERRMATLRGSPPPGPAHP